MNVESFERDTTRVATLRLPNSVTRALGISSANCRSCSGVGFQIAVRGSMGRVFCRCAAAFAAGRAGAAFEAGVTCSVMQKVLLNVEVGCFLRPTQGSRRFAEERRFYRKMRT